MSGASTAALQTLQTVERAEKVDGMTCAATLIVEAMPGGEIGAFLRMVEYIDCGESAADLETYQDRPNTPMQRSAAGDLFLWHSSPNWFFRQDPQGDLHRPAWDTEPYAVNMTAAACAQAALVIWDGEGPIPQAAPGQITVVGGMPGREAINAMGLEGDR